MIIMTLQEYIQENKGVLKNSIRQNIFDKHSSFQIPSKKMEDWKFFDANVWFTNNWNFLYNNSISKDDIQNAISNLEYDSLVIRENGNLISNLSSYNSQIISIDSISENCTITFPYLTNKFETLNALTATNLQEISITTNTQNHHLIILNFITGDSNFVNQISNITIESGAQIQITEIYISKNSTNSIVNSYSQITCNTNSNIEYSTIQCLENSCNSINSIDIIQNQNTQVTTHNYPLCGNFVRNDIRIHKQNIQANSNLYGLFFPGENEHFEIYTKVNHNSPECETTEIYKGLANYNGQGIFSGMIYVAKDAQKTLAKQSNKNILLSENAKIHSKPQLEIYADDVSCNHGSTTGQIDSEALWYLQARGISKQQATILLLEGIMNEVISFITLPTLQDFIKTRIQEKIR